MRALFILLLSLLFCNILFSNILPDDREIRDDAFKFAFLLPTDWNKIDSKITKDSNGVSYSFKKDTVCSIMLLAIRSEQITNMEDFIYTTEKDVSLNIPKRNGDYVFLDNENYDTKSAVYKDQFDTEHIYYFRTKLPDAPYNYVYMLRFITRNWNMNNDIEYQIKKIADSFLPTAR